MRPSTEWSNDSVMFTGPGVLMKDFNHLDICWKDNIAGHKESRRFPECTYHKFLFQVTKEATRGVAVLNLILVDKEGLRSEVQKQPLPQ